jgi:hypothetical protein
VDGWAGWWTDRTTGDTAPGNQMNFHFGAHRTSARVDAVEPNKRMELEFVDTLDDWMGTKLTFDLEQEGSSTLVKFGHRAWRGQNGFFGHCSMQWAVFLLSLKQYVETGKGTPYPHHLEV